MEVLTPLKGMKIKLKKVYYCEFCKKHRLTPNSIKHHEAICTLNPNRNCRMCNRKGIPSDNYESLTDLRLSVKCPMCIFAYIRQHELWKKDKDMEYYVLDVELQRYNQEQDERDALYS